MGKQSPQGRALGAADLELTVHFHDAVKPDPATKVHAVSPNLFRHEMLEYEGGVEGFVQRTMPLIERALADRAPVLVAVRSELSSPLAEELGEGAQAVRFTDMRTLGRNPACIIPEWESFLDGRCNGGAPPLGIGEPVWPGRRAAEIDECMRHEDLLNHAFDGGRAWSLLCPYDLDGLPDEVIEAARHSHTAFEHDWVVGHGGAVLRPADRPARPFAGALPAPPAGVDARSISFDAARLGEVRGFVRGCAAEGLDGERTAQLVLAINELATNSVQYGGGGGRLLAWREQDTIVCEVRDTGHITDLLAGRRRPSPTALGGRGLWLVNQLCDLMQVRSAPGATVVRVQMRIPRT